jgi:ethanolamine ammonia-lyase small subunit
MRDDDERPPATDHAAADALPDAALWRNLRRLTAARIGLPRSGASLATAPLLAFQLAHAKARDAVHAQLDVPRLARDLEDCGLPVLTLASGAADKQTYLMRPDLGRTLDAHAEASLGRNTAEILEYFDIVFVISDGLSARAVQTHAAPVLRPVTAALTAEGWRIAPLVIVERGRVALGDRIASLLRANCVVILIGERPGLSAPESMGAYLTWDPGPATSDADRNCISNMRPDGIDYADAGFKLIHLLRAMRSRGLSGVRLKDASDRLQIDNA